jgi:hypothetical protein
MNTQTTTTRKTKTPRKTIETTAYFASHYKQPSGYGTWAFIGARTYIGRLKNQIGYNRFLDAIKYYNGTYAEAKQQAKHDFDDLYIIVLP